jgi:hypothetical protein
MKSPCRGGLKKIMGMGVHKIIKQMGKVDLGNPTKTVTPKKWSNVTSN